MAPASEAGELRLPSTQIFEPSDLQNGERRPLLLFLHGLGASGKVAFDELGLAAFGARERVFVLAPDGSFDHQGRRFWNAGAACCNFDRLAIDDVGRLGRLLDTWRARPDVDGTRVYVMGHSNGGFMAQRLACSLAERIAAAASLAGAAPPAELSCAHTTALAVLEVHGDADSIVPYQGGTVFGSGELAHYPSAQQGLADWGKRLGCLGSPRSAPALDLDRRLAGSETSVDGFPSCPAGSAALWTVHGGDHSVALGRLAFQAIWQYLSAHHS